ncbi:MAG: YgaP family membrane protein [Desulfitobacterium sp.]
MKCNVGRTEQIVRIVIGVVIVLLGLYFRNWWGIIGLAPIITGAIRYCPVSEVLGISTCDAKNRQ